MGIGHMGAADQGADASSGRWMTIPRTLCFVTNGGDVLLIKRAAHKRVFPGRYDGIGGHLERDEDPRSGAMREIREETGLPVRDVRLRGVSNIDAGQNVGILLFTFTAVSDSRALADCDEGTLEWVPIAAAPGLPLVEDLPILLPRLFGPDASDVPFFAHVWYDSSDKMMLTFAREG
jgi:8-oxo-dGTP diphosphatase